MIVIFWASRCQLLSPFFGRSAIIPDGNEGRIRVRSGDNLRFRGHLVQGTPYLNLRGDAGVRSSFRSACPRQPDSPRLECSYHRRSPHLATLTPEQRQEIQKAGEEPVRLADPETQTEYVILKADVYDRIRALADDTRAAYPLAMKVFKRDGCREGNQDANSLGFVVGNRLGRRYGLILWATRSVSQQPIASPLPAREFRPFIASRSSVKARSAYFYD